MSRHHPEDLWPGGDSVTDDISASSVTIQLPTLTGLGIPNRCAFSTSSGAGVWIKLGQDDVTVSAIGDGSDGIYINAFIGMTVLVTTGSTHVAHRGVVGAATYFTVTPLKDT
jgi:hypothetical protein